MRVFALILVAILCLIQSQPSSAYLIQNPTAAGSSYSGPCDVSGTNCTVAWSTAAMTNACAAARCNLFTLKRTSDNTTCTVKANLTTGDADLTSATNCPGTLTALAWATRGTFTGATISGTTLSFTGSTGSFTSGDQIYGAGLGIISLTAPCTASPCTVGPSVTVSTPTTLYDIIPEAVTTLYDQIGAINLTNASNNIAFIFDCHNLLPCIQSTTTGTLIQAAANRTPNNAVVSYTVVGDRAIFNSAADLWIEENGSANNSVGTNNNANNWRSLGGGTSNGAYAATDATWHAVQLVNGGSTATCTGTTANCVNVDGTETATSTHAPNTTAGKPAVLQNTGASALFFVAGAFSDNASVWSSTVRAAVCANERAHWATTGSC